MQILPLAATSLAAHASHQIFLCVYECVFRGGRQDYEQNLCRLPCRIIGLCLNALYRYPVVQEQQPALNPYPAPDYPANVNIAAGQTRVHEWTSFSFLRNLSSCLETVISIRSVSVISGLRRALIYGTSHISAAEEKWGKTAGFAPYKRPKVEKRYTVPGSNIKITTSRRHRRPYRRRRSRLRRKTRCLRLRLRRAPGELKYCVESHWYSDGRNS